MVAVRTEDAADAGAVGQVIAQAFGDAAVAELADRLRGSSAYIPALSLVADDGGEVVGSVLLTRATVVGSDGVVHPVLNLSPLAVAPERQGQGVGRKLVETVIREATALGESLVLVEGDPALYRRLGFVLASEFGIAPPAPSVPERAFQALPLVDRLQATGGRTTYPPPFWAVGVGLPEPVDGHGSSAVPWMFEFARYAGWLESVASGNHDRRVPACPGWTVGEVLRHLGVVFRLVRRWIDEGRRPTDVPSKPADGDLDTWYADAWRDLFGVLASNPRSTPVATWSPWDDTLGFWQRRMTHETAIHARDVLSAVPDHATPWTACPALAVDGIDEALRLWLGTRVGPDVGGRGQVVRIEVPERAWTVGLHASIVEVHGHPTPSDARVSGSAQMLYAWLWGRSDGVAVDGDGAAVETLRDVLSRAMQ